MKLDKKINNGLKQFQAAAGYMLPIYYKGSIIRIDDKAQVEIDTELLEYEPKIQLKMALDQKHIFETGV